MSSITKYSNIPKEVERYLSSYIEELNIAMNSPEIFLDSFFEASSNCLFTSVIYHYKELNQNIDSFSLTELQKDIYKELIPFMTEMFEGELSFEYSEDNFPAPIMFYCNRTGEFLGELDIYNQEVLVSPIREIVLAEEEVVLLENELQELENEVARLLECTVDVTKLRDTFIGKAVVFCREKKYRKEAFSLHREAVSKLELKNKEYIEKQMQLKNITEKYSESLYLQEVISSQLVDSYGYKQETINIDFDVLEEQLSSPTAEHDYTFED